MTQSSHMRDTVRVRLADFVCVCMCLCVYGVCVDVCMCVCVCDVWVYILVRGPAFLTGNRLRRPPGAFVCGLAALPADFSSGNAAAGGEKYQAQGARYLNEFLGAHKR